MDTEPLIVVLCTVPDTATAGRLARLLVEERLAACVNVIPGLTSIYRWKGAVEEDPEALLLIKTRGGTFEALRARLVAEHPYETPEVVALPVEAVDGAYARWLLEQTARGESAS